MAELYNYKLWNPNLNQFVAQPDRQTADHINAMGGVIILDGGHPMSAARNDHVERRMPAADRAVELTAP